MIAHMIVHTIVRISMHTKACAECTNKFHVEHVCWMMDNSQTDQNTDDRQTVQKNDASVEEDMFLAERIFFRYHIMYQFVYSSTG